MDIAAVKVEVCFIPSNTSWVFTRYWSLCERGRGWLRREHQGVPLWAPDQTKLNGGAPPQDPPSSQSQAVSEVDTQCCGRKGEPAISPECPEEEAQEPGMVRRFMGKSQRKRRKYWFPFFSVLPIASPVNILKTTVSNNNYKRQIESPNKVYKR